MLLQKKHLPHYTVRDYERWEGDWELVEGIPYALASPSLTHQRIIVIISMLYQRQLEENEECKDCVVTIDTDYIVSEDTVFRPDIAVVCGNRDEKITKTPKIIVEVVSPASRKMDEEIKALYYAKEGVKYYLLVYPQEKKMVLKTLTGEGKYKDLSLYGEFYFELEGNCKLKLDPNEVWKRL